MQNHCFHDRVKVIYYRHCRFFWSAKTFIHLDSLNILSMPMAVIWFSEHPDGFVSMKGFPKHIAHYLSIYHGNRAIYGQERNFSFTLQSKEWWSRLNWTYMYYLHSSECEALWGSFWEFTIQHKTSVHGRFANWSIGKNEMVGYYYGSLVYEKLMGCPI